jgi:SAM-dependent methyltransferase
VDEPGAAFKAFEAGAWGERADRYERVTGDVTARVTPSLLDAAGAGPGSRVLDVGCGTGAGTAAAAARGARATGIDLAAGMLDVARRRHPELRFVAGDAEELPFADGEFDAVVAAFVLNHLPDPDRAIAELARVLAPGGRVAVAVWESPERNPLLGELTAAVRDAGVDVRGALPAGPDPYRFADPRELARAFAAAGLERGGTDTLALVHRAGSVDDLWDGLLGGTARISTVIAAAPADARERIRQAFALRAQRHAVDGGGIELGALVALGWARRSA